MFQEFDEFDDFKPVGETVKVNKEIGKVLEKERKRIRDASRYTSKKISL